MPKKRATHPKSKTSSKTRKARNEITGDPLLIFDGVRGQLIYEDSELGREDLRRKLKGSGYSQETIERNNLLCGRADKPAFMYVSEGFYIVL